MSGLRILDLELREATLDDATFEADLFTAVRPSDPEDGALIRHWWIVQARDQLEERWIVTREGRPVGIAYAGHVAWENMPERHARVNAELLPAVRTPERLAALYAHVEARAAAAGTKILNTWAWEDDDRLLGVLTGRGFHEERRERYWECDLVANRERLEAMAEQSRRRMRDAGIGIHTLDLDDDPERYPKIWRMSDEAEQDIPTTVPHVGTPWEVFEEWMRSPGLREDRIWIARDGDDIVGISMLSYPPTRGFVETDWTGTARKIRGRGVARALKCETVMQAITLGVDRVRTDNDGENAPILHLNAEMGYTRRKDEIQLFKPVGPVGPVAAGG